MRGPDRTMRLIIFSALGSVPLHIAAVLVFAGGPAALGPEAGGLVSSAILSGLFGACLMQALGVGRRLFSIHLGPLVGLQAAVLLLLPELPFAAALPGWFVVGAIGGVFMFRGMVAAAQAQQKYLGFLARLVAAMILGGGIALGVSVLGDLPAYGTACVLYAALVCLVYVLTRPSEGVVSLEAAALEKTSPRALGGLWALVPLVLFFTGALMVASHLSVFVRLSDVGADPMAVFGLAKMGGAAILLCTLLLWRRDSLLRMVLSISLLVAAGALLSAKTLIPILAIIIGFEVALNIAGAAFMAEVSRDGPADVRRFIPAAGLAGIALGPALGGYVAAHTAPDHMLYIALSAIVVSVVLHVSFRSRALGHAAAVR